MYGFTPHYGGGYHFRPMPKVSGYTSSAIGEANLGIGAPAVILDPNTGLWPDPTSGVVLPSQLRMNGNMPGPPARAGGANFDDSRPAWGAFGGWGEATGGASLTPQQIMAGSRRPLNAGQLQNAYLILERFTGAGYDACVAMAAVVNALAESNLQADIAGDSGASIGLFQLHEKGAGKGMSVAARSDPTTNTDRILQEVRTYGKGTVSANTPRTAAAAFCREVERPANADVRAQERAELCDSVFPQWSTTPKALLPSVSVPMTSKLAGLGSRFPGGWIGLGVGAAAVVALGVWQRKRIRRVLGGRR